MIRLNIKSTGEGNQKSLMRFTVVYFDCSPPAARFFIFKKNWNKRGGNEKSGVKCIFFFSISWLRSIKCKKKIFNPFIQLVYYYKSCWLKIKTGTAFLIKMINWERNENSSLAIFLPIWLAYFRKFHLQKPGNISILFNPINRYRIFRLTQEVATLNPGNFGLWSFNV